ncbi:hypothetical protein [Aggregatilinea lenta]|uniref:hypothetical protein n=1 Tax=Aggregatilinea lenta TaxID=913108 RepID=UPI000E5BA579|nr:hypothetical protein [Aggregatilinea lenta]
MNIQALPQRLRDPDPRVRVETLRILAMVEETEALRAVEWIAARDPEAGVRDVAQWTAAILREAQERGHSTREAVRTLYERHAAEDREEAFLAELELNLADVGKNQARHFAMEQAYRRQMDDLLRRPHEDADDDVPALPAPDGAAPLSVEGPADFSDLLDAGLTILKVE